MITLAKHADTERMSIGEHHVEKLDLQTPDLTARNIEALAELFPTVVTETRNTDGTVRRGIDFDLLRQELSDHVVEGPHERYRLDWPGKRQALLAANAPIRKTLRPVPDESVDFDTTRNLFIEGDNLEALKLLQESYLGKVKLIYIDPPYNTGNDFIYNDDFAETTAEYLARSGQVDESGARFVANTESNGRFHSDWLSMMYPRLKLARNLLRDDGVIFISIDDGEVDSLKRLCCEVFGERNFVAQIIWQKVYAPKNSARWFSEDHDYLLVFARNRELWQPNPLPRTPEMEARYKNPDSDSRGPWKAVDLTARNRYDAGVYPITTPSGRVIPGPPRGRYWGISEDKFRGLDRDNRIWWGPDGDNAPAVKRFLSEVSAGRTPQTLWTYQEVGHTQDAKKTLLKYVPFEHTENVLNSVKPVSLIQRILQLATSSDSDDLVLDFFSGSGTTAHAVLRQNAEDGGRRRFISVQADEPLPVPEPDFSSILGMSLLRMRNAGKEIKDSHSAVDVGVRVFTIDTPTTVDGRRAPGDTLQDQLFMLTDSVVEGRSAGDLLFHVVLDWGLDLCLPIARETVGESDLYVVDEGLLVACFAETLTREVVTAVAQRQPERAVFRDSAFATDADRINAQQVFAQLAPHTELRTV